MIKTILIDDERLARAEMRRLLASHPEIEIVAEAANAEEALEKTTSLQPDLLFLDIQMPGRTGFEFLEQLDDTPAVIFVTAYDEFALKAFEVSALDYLVKPVAPQRLAQALQKLAHQRSSVPASKPANQRVFVRDGEKCWFVVLEEISLLESEGNYTRLYFGSNRPLILRSLNYLEERLDKEVFSRASRRQILNLRFVGSIEPSVSGGLDAHMKDGQIVEMSRRQAQRFRELMRL